MESGYTYYISEAAKVGDGCDIQHGVIIEDDVVIGKRCKICYYAIIEDGVVIGDDCFIGPFAVIRKGVTIGNKSEVRAHCFIAAEAKIGSNVKIFQYADIGSHSEVEDCVYIGLGTLLSNTEKIAHLRKYKPKLNPVKVKRGARIASCVRILPGVTIGEESLVGVGAIVTKDVPAKEIHFGFPAVKRGNVPKEEFLDEDKIK